MPEEPAFYSGSSTTLRSNPPSPPSARSQFDFQLGPAVNVRFRHLVIATHSVRVHPILISLQSESPLRQERKINLHLTRRPVRHRSHVPILPVPPRHGDVLRNLPVQHLAFVPYGGNWTEKLHDLRLSQIIR